MAGDILLPALSPNMETALVARWLKKVGDPVEAGDAIAEIETDKATMEVEAAEGGVLAAILVPAGTPDVPVNALIGRIASEAEPPTAAAGTAAPESSQPILLPQGLAPTGRIFASPLARRLARTSGIDLAALKGSGPAGRIMKQDVLGAEHARPAPSDPAPSEPPPLPTPEPLAASVPSFEEIPHDGMRLAIARRLSEAKQNIPHFYLTADCELDAMLALRAQVNAALAASARRGKSSLNDWLVKALAGALIEVPEANVSWTDAALRRYASADIAVAVAIPGGLITPVIRRAEEKSISVISGEIRDLAERARERRLRPEEYQGGTASLSNLGMYGVQSFSAILNPPHAVILAVGAAEERIVPRNREPVVATMVRCTLSVDHRAVDGAVAAQLLAAFKRLVENPLALLA